MSAPFVSTRVAMSRRQLLRGAGAALVALPLLDSMRPTFGRARGADTSTSPRRFVAMCATLGFHLPHLIPETAGEDYELTPYLARLKEHRKDFSVFSGLSHPEQQGNNGHASEMTWLTSAPRPGLGGFRNTISLDQLIASKIGTETRFSSLVLSTSGRSMSWTSSGVELPGEKSPAKLFRSLFMAGTSLEVASEVRKLERGQSVLDTVSGQAKKLLTTVGPRDRQKLDEYFTSVRDLEMKMQQSQAWVKKPKPETNAALPKDILDRNDAIGKQKLMCDMIVLALQSDSTRTITLQLSGMNAVPTISGVRNDWHSLSHHGKDPEKINELRVIEEAEFQAFGEFLTKLKGVTENNRSLLDHSAVLFGSNLGNASAHDWRNVPTIVAGGPFRHGRHVAGNAQDNTPLSNLFVQLAQSVNVDIDRFGSSTNTAVSGFQTVG